MLDGALLHIGAVASRASLLRATLLRRGRSTPCSTLPLMVILVARDKLSTYAGRVSPTGSARCSLYAPVLPVGECTEPLIRCYKGLTSGAMHCCGSSHGVSCKHVRETYAVPGVNCQERSRDELLKSLRITLVRSVGVERRPRHAEINDHLAGKMCKDLGVPPP